MTDSLLVADTSVLTRLHDTSVSAVVGPMAAAGRLAMCAPVLFELGVGSRSARDHDELQVRLLAFPQLPVHDADHRRALEVQNELVHRGRHRGISLVDLLVAAIAETRGAPVLHYDADFEIIGDVTGQPHRWVVARGSVP